jgi:hypothetical protein
MERVEGIEPSYEAWKATALPLSYTRNIRYLAVFSWIVSQIVHTTRLMRSANATITAWSSI